MGSQSARPSREEVFHAVKNLRRRYVLYYLQRCREPVELGTLAEQVAGERSRHPTETDEDDGVHESVRATTRPATTASTPKV